jgi:hypothetical protein
MKKSKTTDIASLVDTEVKKITDEQYKIIKALKDDKERLEAEISHLKILLEGSVPTVKFDIPNLGVISNEQLICETQIQFLKELAIDRALTTDEAKRFQIFVDVLTKIKTGGITSEDEIKVTKLSDAELLKLVTDNVIG